METLIQKLKESEVVTRRKVKLSHAGESDFYIDIKKAYGDSEALNLIVDLLWEKMDKDITCIAASGHGGLSLAGALAAKHNLKLVMVRDKPKNHGLDKFIDGYIPQHADKVAIIDDVITTGGSIKQIIKILEPTKALIAGCWVVVKRGDIELGIPLHYLLTAEELI